MFRQHFHQHERLMVVILPAYSSATTIASLNNSGIWVDERVFLSMVDFTVVVGCPDIVTATLDLAV